MNAKWKTERKKLRVKVIALFTQGKARRQKGLRLLVLRVSVCVSDNTMSAMAFLEGKNENTRTYTRSAFSYAKILPTCAQPYLA